MSIEHGRTPDGTHVRFTLEVDVEFANVEAVRVLLEEMESHAWVRIVHITETDPPEQVP